jgi:glycosyltransferase involved in cell wall biosynthesis
MPSLWEEAFGRLPLEAMAAGVPVLASDRGNLKATLGGGGQALALEIPIWMKAMDALLTEDASWVEKGRARVHEYLAQSNEVWTSYFGRRVS